MKTSEFIKKLDEHRDEILNVENIFSDETLTGFNPKQVYVDKLDKLLEED